MKFYKTPTFLAGCLGLFILYNASSFNLILLGWLVIVPAFWMLLIGLHLFLVVPISEAWSDLRATAKEYEESKKTKK